MVPSGLGLQWSLYWLTANDAIIGSFLLSQFPTRGSVGSVTRMQLSSFMHSCIKPFQFSPPVMRKSRRNELGKSSQLAWRLR